MLEFVDVRAQMTREGHRIRFYEVPEVGGWLHDYNRLNPSSPLVTVVSASDEEDLTSESDSDDYFTPVAICITSHIRCP